MVPSPENASDVEAPPSAPRSEDTSFRAAALDALPNPVIACTLDGQVVYGNRQARTLIGCDADAFASMSVSDLLPNATAPSECGALREAADRDATFETELRTASGRVLSCAVEATRIEHEGETLLCGILRDVSDQKHRAPRLIEGEKEKFRLLVEEVTEYAIFMLDAEGNVTSWNEGAERIKGYTEAEILGTHFSTFYPAEAVEAGVPDRGLKTAAEEGQWTDEGWRIRKDGSRFWAYVTITALHDDDGAVRGFAKVTRDITERKRMQEALKESVERYRRLFEESRDAIVLTTPDGTIVDANEAAVALFGYSRDELLQLNAAELYADPEERDRRIVPAIKEASSSRLLEAEMRHRDGHTFLASAAVTVHQDEAGHPELIQALVRDITERRQLEEELLQIQDEERQRLGQELHDGVCSTLTAANIKISAVAEGLRGNASIDPADLDEATEYVKQAAEEARAISHGLSPVGLDGGLLSALDGLASQTEVRGELTCSFEVAGSMPDLSEEVATHLYRIAQEATTNAVKHADAQRIQIRVEADDDALTLTVQDDGPGFPTSSSGTGGLGLRTMRYRANIIDAALTIEDAPGGGALVRCELPLSERG